MNDCIRGIFIVSCLLVAAGITNSNVDAAKNLLKALLNVFVRLGLKGVELESRRIASQRLPDKCSAISINTCSIAQDGA